MVGIMMMRALSNIGDDILALRVILLARLGEFFALFMNLMFGLFGRPIVAVHPSPAGLALRGGKLCLLLADFRDVTGEFALVLIDMLCPSMRTVVAVVIGGKGTAS